MGITAELYEFIVKVVEDKVREVKADREAFDKLAASINALAEAQLRTEERLNELAEAQLKTEERLNQLAARVDDLTKQVNALAESVDKLVVGLDSLRVEVGRLSDVVGFGLEDVARVVLPGWLHRRLGVEVEELRREFLRVDGEEVEVNLYGEGLREGVKVTVIGEVKSRVYSDDVSRFYERVFVKARRVVEGEALGVLFGYLIHPSAKRRAKELGLYTVASYER